MAEDTLYEPDLLAEEQLDLEEEEKAHAELLEKAGDLASLIDEMSIHGGVNYQTAADIEALEPGIFTDKMAIESFTRDFSPTNFRMAMESAEALQAGLHYALIAGVIVIMVKVMSWVWKAFKNNGPTCEGTDVRRGKAKAALEITYKNIKDFHDVASAYPEAYASAVEAAKKDVISGVSVATPSTAFKVLTMIEREKIRLHLRHSVSPFIMSMLKSPNQWVPVIHTWVEYSQRVLTPAVNAVRDLEDDIKNGKEIKAERYAIPLPAGVRSIEEFSDQIKRLHAALETALTPDENLGAEMAEKNDINVIISFNTHLNLLKSIDSDDKAIEEARKTIEEIEKARSDNADESKSAEAEIKKIASDINKHWKCLTLMLQGLFKITKAAQHFDNARSQAAEDIVGMYVGVIKHLMPGVSPEDLKKLQSIKDEIQKAMKEAPAATTVATSS